jgi:hypothetical protein
MDQASAGASRGGEDERDHFIPVRKIDVLDALIEHGSLSSEAEQEKFRQFARLLGAIYHYEYFDQLERLRNDYYYFRPDLDGQVASQAQFDPSELDRAYRDMIEALTRVLHGANFVEIPHDDIARAHREHAIISVNIKTPLDDYREVRFFRRGHHKETTEVSSWFGLRKRTVEYGVYDDVVLLVTMKPAEPLKPGTKRTRKPKIRPGAVLLKYFRDIASADLRALYPDVRVTMGLRDQLVLGVPAIVGGIPILLKLASTLTILMIVAGFYLGFANTVRDDEMAGALAAVSGLVALGGFITTQWVRFQRQSLLHQKTLSENVYYRNVNNNAGIFDFIIGEAEEQECKEAFLAYYFLLHPGDGPTEDQLDQRIEGWLREAFSADVDFECDDALGKLDRLGLLKRDGDRLSALPLDEALTRLDLTWDNFFAFDTGRLDDPD